MIDGLCVDHELSENIERNSMKETGDSDSMYQCMQDW